jgi:riboflavin kinase/FMN adenylyltransferase
MQIFYGIEGLGAEWDGAVVCAGTFDGVHLGHCEVLGRAVAKARTMGLPCVLVTFDRNPAAILAPDKLRPSISSVSANLTRIGQRGVDIAVVLPFDLELAHTSAEDFFNRYLIQKLKAKAVVIGHDFTFGKDRVGTPEWLSERIETEVVQPFLVDGKRVGSSHIRQLVETGDVEEASKLLGRDFEIEGVVVSGQKLGRTLGYPTINLARSFWQVTPLDGVYGGACRLSSGTYKAAVSVGVRPTVDDLKTIEAYLLDYAGPDLYGQSVTLALRSRLRDPMKFDNLEDLKNQIASDVAKVSCVS